MKKIRIIAVVSFTGILLFTTCKKGEDNPARTPVQVNQVNHAPVANAGADISTKLASCSSKGSADLDGSASSDPDNNPLSYTWTKISGPSNYTINPLYTAKAKVVNLLAGQYAFELTVKDPGGLTAKDTVVVNVEGASPPEYDLDITINGTFHFDDNYQDCYYYTPCHYYDATNIDGVGSFAPIGQFNFYGYEQADTAAASDVHSTYLGLYNNNGASVYGTSSVNFKKLIQSGGGSFSGTFTVTDGSAKDCNQNIFNNLVPLTITGTLDKTANTVSLTIKGKVYF